MGSHGPAAHCVSAACLTSVYIVTAKREKWEPSGTAFVARQVAG